jgi:hypothetical protein
MLYNIQFLKFRYSSEVWLKLSEFKVIKRYNMSDLLKDFFVCHIKFIFVQAVNIKIGQYFYNLPWSLFEVLLQQIWKEGKLQEKGVQNHSFD